MRQAWKGFLPCLETNHTDDQVHLEESLRVVNSLCEDVSQAAGCEMIENQSFEPIFKLFDVYLDYLIQENGTLSAFWMYVDIVEVMLGLVRASREGVCMGAAPRFHSCNDSLVLRRRQTELSTLSSLL